MLRQAGASLVDVHRLVGVLLVVRAAVAVVHELARLLLIRTHEVRLAVRERERAREEDLEPADARAELREDRRVVGGSPSV